MSLKNKMVKEVQTHSLMWFLIGDQTTGLHRVGGTESSGENDDGEMLNRVSKSKWKRERRREKIRRRKRKR